ncbi:unnamed protein product [Durusdinium trenchii]|uniref:Uncharacterized protein n=1 Tax=Durusdinium trenchii TaxID=1381693 RepID=A0ABP0RQA7_9DINO
MESKRAMELADAVPPDGEAPEASPGEAKRRRLAPEDVQVELRKAGLVQPAMAFIQQVDKRRRLTAPPDCPLKMTKRQGQELAIDVMKRRRIVPEQVPVLKVPPSTWGTDIQELSMPSDILPFRPMSAPSGLVNTNHCVQLLLSGAAGLKQVTLDSHGIFFEVHDHGFMMTELPRGWQPIVNSSGRLVRVAKVALDFKGTAYFLSELGELLMMVSAVRYLERPSPCENEIKLEFVDKQKIPSYAEEDNFSPSTVYASPGMEDATDDDDDAMEWEDL